MFPSSLIAAAVDGSTDQFLVGEGTVDLGGVNVDDAQVQRPMNGAESAPIGARIPGHTAAPSA